MSNAARLVVAAVILAIVPTPSVATWECVDAHGKFVRCGPVKNSVARCRTANGKVAKCGSIKAKPA